MQELQDVRADGYFVRECRGPLSIRLGSGLEWLRSYRVAADRSPGRDAERDNGHRRSGVTASA